MSKILSIALLALPILGMPLSEITPTSSNTLSPRQYFYNDVSQGCPHSTISGGPKRQAYHHWQVTDNMSCGSASGCGTTKLKSHTFGVDAGFTIANIVGLGAGVSESWTSGETYTCDGIKGDTVCVWVNVAYTVFDLRTADGCSDKSLEEAKFPNKDNAGGGYYCVTGKNCRSIDQHYWE